MSLVNLALCVPEKRVSYGLGFGSHIMEEGCLSGDRVWPGKASSGSLGGTFQKCGT